MRFLPRVLGQQRLTDGVIHLVGASVIQILALQSRSVRHPLVCSNAQRDREAMACRHNAPDPCQIQLEKQRPVVKADSSYRDHLTLILMSRRQSGRHR